MLPKSLDQLARDIEAEHDSSSRLEKALKPTENGVTRAHQLELITRVLDHACKSHSASAEKAFRIALASLRTLVPFLKKKTASLTDTIAAVEKYAVNFALSSSAQDAGNSPSFSRAAELSMSLQKILVCRAETQKGKRDSKRLTRRNNTRRKQNKENENPDQNTVDNASLDSKLIDQLIFPRAAATLGMHMLLPQKDSVDVATTTTGALSIRLTRCCVNMSLSDIVALAEKVVLPWLNYVQSFDDSRSQRTYAAYLKRVSCFLFDQCRRPQSDPATVLRTRFFALQLEDPKLNRFATDLLQSAKNFARGRKQEKHNRNVLDTLASVYESAIRYVAKFDCSDRRWVSEDVSAWLDHVAFIWGKRKPRKSLPNVFCLRLSAFRNEPEMERLLECLKLQNDLFSIGAYELDVDMVLPQDLEFYNPMWKNIASVLKSVTFEDLLDSEAKAIFLDQYVDFSDDWRVAEADGLRCLRLMRTLEPLRRFIAAGSPKSGLPEGAELILRTYLSALFRGFCVLSCPLMNKDSPGTSALSDVLLRLNKMVGGGIEAAQNLIRSYAHKHLFGSLEDVLSVSTNILQHHDSYSPSASQSWREWLYTIMASVSKNVFVELPEGESEEDKLVLRLSEAISLCADQLLKCATRTSSFTQGYWTLQTTLRDGLLSRRLWWEAAEVSFRLFERVTSSETTGRAHSAVSEAGRMVSQDVVRLSRNGYALTFLADRAIPADMLLSAFVEYSWWARKNRNSFKTSSKYLETSDGLLMMRWSVFQAFDMSGLLCPVRRTHEQWLAFMITLRCSKAGRTENIWKPVKLKACSGHYTLGLTDPHAGEVLCTTSHCQFLENLRKACEHTALGAFKTVSKALCALESSFPAKKKLLRHFELLTIAVEALEWISTVLAFNSFGVSANRALSLADQCASIFSIPLSNDETLKVCRLLDSLPRRRPDEVDEKVVDTVKVLSKDAGRSISNASQVLQKAKSDLKQSLKTLSKFRLGANEDNPQSYSVAGLSVDVSFMTCSMCGWHRLSLVLEVVRYLFTLGTAQVDIESLSEGRYYMDLCLEVSSACFPLKNNSLRRIASVCRAKCLTRMDSRVFVQDSFMKQVPIEEGGDPEDGRDTCSSFSAVQCAADAMLYVEIAWNVEANTADIDLTLVDFIIALYERCQRMLENERQNTMARSALDSERARLSLNLGLTYLLKGDETSAAKLIKPLSECEDSREGDIVAAASYQVARLFICQGGGLQTCFAESSDPSNGQRRRVRKRRPKRANCGRMQFPADEPRAALSRAVRSLMPRLGNFPLCRKVWNLAAMVEREPELMASKLEKTVGLSFNARYDHSTRCKLVKRAENIRDESARGDIDDIGKHLQELSLTDTGEPDSWSDAIDVVGMLTRGRSILVGVHMDEQKNSIVLWRRCALGFHLKRLWLPSTGPQSYHGILQRIELILSEMKQSSVTDGQEMTDGEKRLWWEDRYKLDNEMKVVLSEIQDVWLGAAVSLMIPSVAVDAEDSSQRDEREFESYTELGERACDGSDDRTILGHLILLVDKPSERIPWESLPLLRENEIAATRTPSLAFLESVWNPDRSFNNRNTFYVLNPDGNLRRTEDRFREKFHSHLGWSGTTGETSAEMVAASYNGEEIYVYCGHGAGEELFSPSKLCVDRMAPVALLMGCSSCRPRDLEIGDFESNGPAIEFLVQGSPAVVGNLWDVSDGEIDRLTSSVLSLWLSDEKEGAGAGTVSLAEAVAQSRSKCRLPYLVGAACIVMGVPDIHAGRDIED